MIKEISPALKVAHVVTAVLTIPFWAFIAYVYATRWNSIEGNGFLLQLLYALIITAFYSFGIWLVALDHIKEAIRC